MKTVRSQFPIFQSHPELIYLDSASTLQKSQRVIDAVSQYLSESYANIHRGMYELSQRSEQLYEDARSEVAGFINAVDPSEVVFTGNTTDGINTFVRSLIRSGRVQKEDNIILTTLEHHANLVPWQVLCEQTGAHIRWVYIDENSELNVNEVKKLIDKKTKIISLSLCSNVTGKVWEEEIKQIVGEVKGQKDQKIRRQGESEFHYTGGEVTGSRLREDGCIRPLVAVDASQYVVHKRLDVQALGVDVAFFTGHKLGALTGIGVMRGRSDILKPLVPGKVGGGAVDQVHTDGATFLGSPDKFEPGTPNVVGAISLMEAVRWIQPPRPSAPPLINGALDGMIPLVEQIEKPMVEYCLREFGKLEAEGKVRLLGGYDGERVGVFSFVPQECGVKVVDRAMQEAGIAMRVGAHCTHVYHARMGGLAPANQCEHSPSPSQETAATIKKSCRISLWVYNEVWEVERFFEVLRGVMG